ncbi:TatD family hydrolase [Candidatus Pyrohabitans sp.]
MVAVLSKEATVFRGEFPITDDHMHLDPRNGEGLEAVKKFAREGGKNIFLVTKLTKDIGLSGVSVENFARLFEETIKLAEQVGELGVRAFPVLGVHPAEFHFMAEHRSLEEAKGIAEKALELAAQHVCDGRAFAIGEVGRPHYPVAGEIREACEALMLHSFELARDADCAVQLHTESIDEAGFTAIAELADRAGLRRERVVKHFSPPLINRGEELGIMPSLIATRKNISAALEQGTRFLMESDYIDDSSRPGAVVSPRSVPRVTKQLYAEGRLTEEEVWRIHFDNVERTYSVLL